ncbi:MAG: hypothetical protein EOR60_28295 [Mesorhizobium sp.]|nr:MAG: hypothetical protein EOR60_28295 [Mesorhizobium sp.]
MDEVDDQQSHIVMFGAANGQTTFSGCIYDRFNSSWVSKVCLTVAERSFNFDPIFEATMRFRDFVLPFVIQEGGATITYPDKLPMFSMRIVVSEPTQEDLA